MGEHISPAEVNENERLTSVKPGDKAELVTIGANVTVLTPPDSKGEITVQAGAMKLKANLKDLRKAKPEPKNDLKSRYAPKKPSGGAVTTARAHAEMECDLRGMTVEEAITQLELFLDGARMDHLKTVSVIHGKGTGALRNAVHMTLKRIPDVDSFRLGHYGEGEDGVTIVSLK